MSDYNNEMNDNTTGGEPAPPSGQQNGWNAPEQQPPVNYDRQAQNEMPPQNGPEQRFDRPPYSEESRDRYQSNVYPPEQGGWNQSQGGPQGPQNGYQNQNGYGSSQGFGGGYQSPRYQRPSHQQQMPTYQYNPKTGWQQGGAGGGYRPDNGYQWNFQDYDRLDRNRSGAPKKQNKGLLVFTISLVGVLIISLLGLTGYSVLMGRDSIGSESSGTSQASGEDGVLYDGAQSNIELELASKPQIMETLPMSGALTVPQIAKQVTPSVVGVSAYQNARFYEPISVGSGIVMTEDGYIITNAHVVAGGMKFKVQLFDSTPYDAVLIGADNATDLAVLKIDVEGLTPAVFGDSDQIEVGETVVAIGNPSGSELASSVTKGIVSAVNRRITTENYDFVYIQTDAAINPGNSGGALINEYGQVIGINSSKIIASGYEGIGFAIPVTSAKPILDDLITNGRVTGRAMLGIGCELVTEADSVRYGIPMGLEIKEVYERSDLKNKDVQMGDILMELDGVRVYTLPDVQRLLKERDVGDTVTLKLYRRISTVESKEIIVEAVLIEN